MHHLYKRVPAASLKTTSSSAKNSSTYLAGAQLSKKIFFISLFAMLGIFWACGYNVGFHSDEMDMNAYGKANYAFYFSEGKDTSFLHPTLHDKRQLSADLRYYGSAFEYLAVGLNKLTGLDKGAHEFDSRHALNELMAVIAILFAGYIAAKIYNWKAAIFTQWLLFLTPLFFGNALYDTKDIPFCAGYTASLYFIICFLEQLPSPEWRTCLFTMLAFAFAFGTRIAGVLLILYSLLFSIIYYLKNTGLREAINKNMMTIAFKIGIIIAGSLGLTILSWPYLLLNPVKNLFTAIHAAQKFPERISVLFNGTAIDSLHLPANYIPEMMLLTIPIFILISFVISIVTLSINYKKEHWIKLLLIVFASLFPVIYSVATRQPLYDGWRHLLFVYPGITIISGVGLSYILDKIKLQILKIAFFIVVAAGMLPVIIWGIENHPYEYVYFNELEGGFKNAYYNFDTDYWQVTAKTGVDWLMRHEPILNSKDTVTIASNVRSFVSYYIARRYPKAKIKITDVSCKKRSGAYWQYAVFNILFLEPSYLEDCFPPCGTVYSVDIDDMPATAVLADSSRLDYLAVKSFEQNDFKKSDSLLEVYMTTVGKNNGLLYGLMAGDKVGIGQYKEAIAYGNKDLEIVPDDAFGNKALGFAYANLGQYKEAIFYLQRAAQSDPKDPNTERLLANMYQVTAAQHKQ